MQNAKCKMQNEKHTKKSKIKYQKSNIKNLFAFISAQNGWMDGTEKDGLKMDMKPNPKPKPIPKPTQECN